MSADKSPAGNNALLPESTLVTLTRDVDNSTGGHPRLYTKGTTFIIEDCVDAAESEDGKPFYWGSTDEDSINNIWAPADAVALVKTAAQMAARTIPTRDQLLELASLEILASGNGFAVNGTDKDVAAGTIECHGITEDGLHFAFTISVGEPQRASM